MSPAGVLVYTLTSITFVAAVDTAVALFLSSNCATAEKPFLVLPGSDIPSGNCVDDLVIDYLAPDWKSIQVISLGGDCSVHAYYDKSCAGGVAQVNANECVLFDSKPAEAIGISDGLPIRSFRINGGDCKLPSKAVLSTSADVPPASSTRTADPMNTVVSMADGSQTTEATSQTTFNFGPSSATNTIKSEETVPTASNAAGEDHDSDGSHLSTILAATIIPFVAISALLLLWYICYWRPSRSRHREHVSLSMSTSSSDQSASHRAASASGQARQHNGNNVTSTTYHYYGDSRHPSRNESPVTPGQIGSHLR